MKKVNVGDIEGYEVLYLPERDLVFCKNTVLPFKVVKEISSSSLDRLEYEEKNLVVRIFSNSIELGCLTTSKDNFSQIYKKIKSQRCQCKA